MDHREEEVFRPGCRDEHQKPEPGEWVMKLSSAASAM